MAVLRSRRRRESRAGGRTSRAWFTAGILGAGAATVWLVGKRTPGGITPTPVPTPTPSPTPLPTPTPTLPAPTNLALQGATANTLTYSWDPVPGATGYSPFVNGVSQHVQVATAGATVAGLLPSTIYNLQVRAHMGTLQSSLSTKLSASTTA